VEGRGAVGAAQRLAAVLVLALAAMTRFSAAPLHFRDGRLIPADADSAMHLRRAILWVEQAPWPPVRDPFLAFPDGAPMPWSPGWSAALGAFGALLSGGDTGSPLFHLGVALWPLLVGVATVAVAMGAAGRLWGARAGLTAGVCAALTPQLVAATQFARLDHNGAEAFFLVAFAAEASRTRPRRWAVALLTAGACLGWVGGFVYVTIGAFALMVAALMDPGQRPFERAGIGGLLAGAALLAPVAALNGVDAGAPFSYATLSAFHPVFIAAITGGSAWLLAVVHRPALRRRLLVAGAVAGTVGAVAVGPVVADGVRQWLVKENPWLATIQEMNPILKGPAWQPASWAIAARVLGWAYPFAPLLGLWLAWREWRARGRGAAGVAAVLICAWACWALTHLQVRFGWTLAPLLGVLVGGALSTVPLAPALALLLFAQPPAVLEAAWLNPRTRQNRVPWNFQVYQWLREGTPPVDRDRPEYGVLSTWDHGHWITAIGERPQYMGHFGNYAGGLDRYLFTEGMLAGEPAALLAAMDADRLQYLVVDAEELMASDGPLRQLMVAGSAGARNPAVPGLRAAFASLPDPGVPYEGVPGAWVYERVAGAVVSGRGAPGEAVELTLPLFYSGAWRAWRYQGEVDADGRWRARLPYWTGDQGWVPTGERYEAHVGERAFSFPLPEDAVRAGAEVALGRR
jgi:hypothetical protein